MSQYTMSLNSLINLESYYTKGEKCTFGNDKNKIEVGRKVLFSDVYGYNVPEPLKTQFETGFIIQNIERNICYNDSDLWLMALKNDLSIKAPLFVKKWQAIEQLKVSEIAKVRESETTGNATSKGKSENNSKGLSSNYPENIKRAGNLEDVRYLDSGTMNNSTGSNSAESETKQKTIESGNNLDKMQLFFDMQKNIVQEFIDSFNNLFMKIF